MKPFKTLGLALALSVLGWSGLAYGAAIHDAARMGDVGWTKELVQARPDLVNAKTETGRTPLHFAAEEGSIDRRGHPQNRALCAIGTRRWVNPRDRSETNLG